MADGDNGWGDSAPNSGRVSPPRDEPRGGYEDSRDNRDSGRPQRDSGIDANPGNNLHIAGLAMRTRESDLEEIFGKFGKIEKAQIMKDPHTRESRGFGFVTFEEAEDADAAMAALNATTLDDRTISVEKARRGRARTPTPGAYKGPPKRDDRPPRGGYDQRRDDRRPRYDDRRSGSGYGRDPTMAAPMRGDDRRYDDRPSRGYDDRPPRGYDDRPSRSYDDRPPRSFDDGRAPRGGGGYDDRRGGYGSAAGGPPAAYDDRRGGGGGGPPDYGRRERDYEDRRPRDYPTRAGAEEPRRY